MKERIKEVLKTSGTYFVLLYAIVTIVFIIFMMRMNVLPLKYLLPVIIALLLLIVGMYFLQFGKRVNKINKILGKVLIVVLCGVMVYASTAFSKTEETIKKVTENKDMQTTVVSVIVLKENKAEEIKDLKTSSFGTVSIGEVEFINKALDDIKKDLNVSSVKATEYDSYKDYADDLYDEKVDAIILNEGSRGIVEDQYQTFSDDTKVIKQYKYKTEVKDISKDVDVTKEPFNVYISGIDTYGGISTVARSDVNMIASVNPNTHQILLTSIPRDFYIPQTCQNNQKDKLTHTGIYGVDCTIESVEKYMDIDLNYYVRVNFSSLIDIVDALGGITVENPHTFTSFDGNYFPAGNITLNGTEALSFSRERHAFADGDKERGRDQMRVITGIINKAISPSIIANYSNVLDSISGSFETNMGNKDVTAFIKKQLNDMSVWDIKQIQVSGTGSTEWTPANGFNAYVMIPNEKSVTKAKTLIEKMHNGEKITDEDIE
ncbi:LCP family protein [Erysipelotrichaceae bacterium HCN-30851]